MAIALEREKLIVDVERRLEEKILASIGKWATRIIVTVIAATFAGAGAWFSALGRIEKLEVWKLERTKPIEDYYRDKQDTAAYQAKVLEIMAEMKESQLDLKSRIIKLEDHLRGRQ